MPVFSQTRFRVLHIQGSIDSQTVDEVGYALGRMAEISKKPIAILIDSVGGDAVSSEKIARFIRKLKIKTTGVVIFSAYSGAFYILQACTWRTASIYAKVMFHPPRKNLELVSQGSLFPHERDIIYYNDREYIKMLKRLSKRSGLALSALESFGINNRMFTATEALDHKLVDNVFYPGILRNV